MGIYVIVADYDKNSPAKKIADKAVLVDALDVDALVKLCIKENVNGVTTGFTDVLLSICLEVCTRLELPCYLNEKMIEISTNKNKFKETCRKYSIPVPNDYNINEELIEEEAKRNESNIQYLLNRWTVVGLEGLMFVTMLVNSKNNMY